MSFTSTLGPDCSGGKHAGFSPYSDDGPHHPSTSPRSFIVQTDVGSGPRRTSLFTSSRSPANNAAATQRNVHVCTENDVLSSREALWRSVAARLTGCTTFSSRKWSMVKIIDIQEYRIICLTVCDGTWADDIVERHNKAALRS